MDAVKAYPYGQIPGEDLPTDQKSNDFVFDNADTYLISEAVFANCRRIRECYQEWLHLQTSPDTTDTLYQRLLQLVSIYCLINANAFAYKFYPGDTYELVETVKSAMELVRERIASRESETDIITIDSDTASESDMVVEEPQQENKENVI